jgi:hypothetical protein
LVAAKDIPEGEESQRCGGRSTGCSSESDRRGALTAAYDATVEAHLIAKRSEPVYIRNERLRERYNSQGDANRATMVRKARKERERRENEYSERERWKREMERKRFLGEGVRKDLD